MKIIFLLLCFFAVRCSFANVGVFDNFGANVLPNQNKDIRLQFEKVSFKFCLDKNSKQYGSIVVPFVRVDAGFNLKNTDSKTINLQMGFPFFDLQELNKEDELIKRINFTVNVLDKKFEPIVKEGFADEKLDPNGIFKKVLVWEDTFNPYEEKTVNVSYIEDMTVSALPSIDIFYGGQYSFVYVTGALQTWQQPIDKAEFIFDFEDIKKSIKTEIAKKPIVFYMGSVLPVADTGKTHIVYKKSMPADKITISILFYHIPSNLYDLKKFIKDLKNGKVIKDDVDDKNLTKGNVNFVNEKQTIDALLKLYKDLEAEKINIDPQSPPQEIKLMFNEDKKNIEEMIKYLENNNGHDESKKDIKEKNKIVKSNKKIKIKNKKIKIKNKKINVAKKELKKKKKLNKSTNRNK